MATQTVAASVSSALTIRNLPWLQSILQGGHFALIDRETSIGVKEGVLRPLGHLNPTGGGASFQPKVKSSEFISAMSTGVGVVEGKPISQMDPMIQCKINAPTMRLLALALYAGAATTATQSVVSSDAQKVIDGTVTPFVLGVWYLLGAQNITKFIASKDVSGTFTDLVVNSDYFLDTELGAIKFVATGTLTLTGAEKISCLYQAAAITSTPIIAMGSVPRFIYAGVYIYTVLAANEAKAAAEVFLSYMPRARLEPTGNIDIGVDKAAEITMDFYAVPSTEISGYPFGYAFKQLAGTLRDIV
jgi:hypothetical protein